MHGLPRQRLNPRKLLLGKWTAVAPRNKEKHFIVVRVLEPAAAGGQVEYVELEAVYSRRCTILPWAVLNDRRHWLQGWC